MPYGGPAELTLARALGSWTADPVAIAVAVGLVAFYLTGVRRVRRAGGTWSGRRVGLYAVGVVLLLLATAWWVGAYARTLFWVYTLQVMVLLVGAPAFLALGRPVSLVRAAWPGSTRSAAARILDSGPARALRSPAVATLAIPAGLGVIFFTGVLDASLRHVAVHHLLHVALLVAGFVVAVPLAEDDPRATGLSIAAGMFLGVIDLLLDAIPGIVVRLRTHLLAPDWFLGLHRPWGPSPLHDQQFGGAILWFVAEFADLPFLALLTIRWIRTDEREAARIDRELDLAAASAALADDGEDRIPVPGDPEGRSVPWWEVDGSVFGSERAARYRARRPRPPAR